MFSLHSLLRFSIEARGISMRLRKQENNPTLVRYCRAHLRECSSRSRFRSRFSQSKQTHTCARLRLPAGGALRGPLKRDNGQTAAAYLPGSTCSPCAGVCVRARRLMRRRRRQKQASRLDTIVVGVNGAWRVWPTSERDNDDADNTNDDNNTDSSGRRPAETRPRIPSAWSRAGELLSHVVPLCAASD